MTQSDETFIPQYQDNYDSILRYDVQFGMFSLFFQQLHTVCRAHSANYSTREGAAFWTITKSLEVITARNALLLRLQPRKGITKLVASGAAGLNIMGWRNYLSHLPFWILINKYWGRTERNLSHAFAF